MLRIVTTFFCAVVFISSHVASAQVAKVYPVDEADRDPEFFNFRARLLVALQEHDTNFLYSILTDNIGNSFGGIGGIDEFKERWKPEQPNSKVWSTLTEILARGGQFFPPEEWSDWSRMFVAPYTYSATGTPGFDPYKYGIVTSQGVRVRAQPDTSSPVLTNLSFDLVRVTAWPREPVATALGERRWVTVELVDGRSGYVAADFVVSRWGYRATFVSRDGRWLLRTLIAGD